MFYVYLINGSIQVSANKIQNYIPISETPLFKDAVTIARGFAQKENIKNKMVIIGSDY